ncbi:MAG: ROK family protein [Caldilinea sp.]|uniref:ROK family protein n=1 Tax=Caldilinea sp. TaxID=2293560 RepID=UPI00309DA8BE
MQVKIGESTRVQPNILAVDVGGSKVAAALVTADGVVHHRVQAPTSQRGPVEGIDQIAALLQKILEIKDPSTNEIAAIGLGVPAVLEEGTDRVIWAPNLAGWRNVDLRGPLQARFGWPVYLEYDGHAATLAEWWLGAGKNLHSFVNVIIGTGIGGGMVLDGRLVRGVNRLAGAAGWFAFTTDPAVAEERDRSVGAWEAKAAGPGIVSRARALLASAPDSTLARVDEEALTAEQVFAAAQQGDELARSVIEETAEWIGLGLANIVSLVNPQAIVLGGGVGVACAPLLPRILDTMKQWAQPWSARSCCVAISALGADAGLLGAAYGARLRLGL